MQDVRLQILEARVDKLENPAPPTLAEITINLALVLTMELAVIFAPHIGVGLIAGFLAAKTRWTSRRIGTLSRKLESLNHDLARYQDRLHEARNSLDIHAMYGSTSVLDTIDVALVPRFMANVVQEKARITRKLESLRMTGEDKGVLNAVQAMTPTPKGKWDEYLQSIKSQNAHATQGRIGEDLGAALQKYVQAGFSPDASIGVYPVFLTSDYVSPLLTQIGDEKARISDSYSESRLAVRYKTDELLLDDEGLELFFVGAFDAIIDGESKFLQRQAVRGALVAGIEFTCWLNYLNRMGALAYEPNVETEASIVTRKYAIVNDVLVLEELNNNYLPTNTISVPQVTLKGDRYPGIGIITEYLADYLYQRFAKLYLRNSPEKIVPWDYDESVYSEAAGLPSRLFRGLLNNSVRDKRIAELKLIVILAIRDFLGKVQELATIPVFDDDATHKVSDYLPLGSGLRTQPALSTADIQQATDEALFGLGAAVAQTDFAMKSFCDLSRVQLEVRINDLMALVNDYQHRQQTDTLDSTTAQQILEQIQSKKDSATAHYEQLRATLQSQEQDELLKEVETQYGPIMADLANYDADTLVSPDVAWAFFESIMNVDTEEEQP
jgi:hypothetical protein